MLISIIICSLNGAKVLPECIRSILQTTYSPYEIIVVDNGSTDGTSDVIRKGFPTVSLIRSSRNLGFAGGNNLGMRSARGEILVLLNDDTTIDPNWLNAAVQAQENLPDWGILGAKLLYPDEITIQHAGGKITRNALTEHIGNGETDSGQYDYIRRCDYVTGAAFFINRAVLEDIGYLDDGYFPIYFEEVDYCRRVQKAGYAVYYIPDIKVFHFESRTTDKYSTGFLNKYHKNRIRFVFKTYSLRELLRFPRAELRWLRSSHDPKLIAPLVRSYCVNLVKFPLIFAWRLKDARRISGK